MQAVSEQTADWGRQVPPFSLAGQRVWVAGHRGMVGSAVCRRLQHEDCEIVTEERGQLDLTRQAEVEDWMAAVKPAVVIVAAARVGGIHANSTQPAEFIYENLAIETNIIHSAHCAAVSKLLFLGSSCIYPRQAPQPMSEEALLNGALEPTNQWYAVAKIAGVKLCQAYRHQYGCDFISAMPTNLYGPDDNYDLMTSHVVPALIRKCHQAKCAGLQEVEIWGTGRPRREFLYVDDLADALVFLLVNYSGGQPVNVGSGTDISIAELAAVVARVVGYPGGFCYDEAKPDGTMRKLLDVGRLATLGWRTRTSLEDGLAASYRWYLENVAQAA